MYIKIIKGKYANKKDPNRNSRAEKYHLEMSNLIDELNRRLTLMEKSVSLKIDQ